MIGRKAGGTQKRPCREAQGVEAQDEGKDGGPEARKGWEMNENKHDRWGVKVLCKMSDHPSGGRRDMKSLLVRMTKNYQSCFKKADTCNRLEWTGWGGV